MRITRIRIKHFRSIERLEFEPNLTTAICGTNSSGKSNLLRALRLAFLPNLDSAKLAENVTSWTGPHTKCEISLRFDKAPKDLAQVLQVKQDAEFEFSLQFKRSGNPVRYLNGVKIDSNAFEALSAKVLVVHVPAIRDIATDGLNPFREALLTAAKRQKGPTSLSALNKAVRQAVGKQGSALLTGTRRLARDWMKVDQLDIDASQIAFDDLVKTTGIRVRSADEDFELSKLGTGHQSGIVLTLYRQLAVGTKRSVIFLFEEPDNHLHPSSIQVVANELKDCVSRDGAQVFLTTHSPYLLNHFDFDDVLPLATNGQRATQRREVKLLRPAKEVRMSLSKYGLRPAEALLARRVIVVEGPNDVSAVRALVEQRTNIPPEREDTLIVPAGGKTQVLDLCDLLVELGASWKALLDWDALLDTELPMLLEDIDATSRAAAEAALNVLKPLIRSKPTKKSKAAKLVDALLFEAQKMTPAPVGFPNSVVGRFVTKKQRMSPSSLAALKRCISRGEIRKVNAYLNDLGIYVWKDAIEAAVVPPSAEGRAETFFAGRNYPVADGDPVARRNSLLNATKRLAHDPHVMQDLVSALWREGCYRSQEAMYAAKFLSS